MLLMSKFKWILQVDSNWVRVLILDEPFGRRRLHRNVESFHYFCLNLVWCHWVPSYCNRLRWFETVQRNKFHKTLRRKAKRSTQKQPQDSHSLFRSLTQTTSHRSFLISPMHDERWVKCFRIWKNRRVSYRIVCSPATHTVSSKQPQ